MSIFTSSFSSFSRNLFLATSSFLVVGSLFLSVPAQATSVIQGAYDRNSEQYVFDAPNSNFASGTRVIVWPMHDGPNQNFSYHQFRAIDQYPADKRGEIKVGGKCLDAFGGLQTGAEIGLWDCHGGMNQIWNFKLENPTESVNSNYSAKYTIRPSANAHYCIDAAGALTPGTQLILWPCHGGSNQLWRHNIRVYTN